MKKSKIFMATGALVLAISAIFATKANKKFAPVNTGVSGNFKFYQLSGAQILTTKSGTPQLQVQLCTANGHAFSGFTSGDLVTITASEHPIYIN
jgi:hypothetical protein